MAATNGRPVILTSLDKLDGLGAGEKMIQPRWVMHEWPKKEFANYLLIDDTRKAAYRLDRGTYPSGWQELNDLVAVICGHEFSLLGGTHWHLIAPVDLVKVMAAFRMLGVDDRLEICLPPEYAMKIEAHSHDIDEQIRSSVQLSRTLDPNATA